MREVVVNFLAADFSRLFRVRVHGRRIEETAMNHRDMLTGAIVLVAMLIAYAATRANSVSTASVSQEAVSTPSAASQSNSIAPPAQRIENSSPSVEPAQSQNPPQAAGASCPTHRFGY